MIEPPGLVVEVLPGALEVVVPSASGLAIPDSQQVAHLAHAGDLPGDAHGEVAPVGIRNLARQAHHAVGRLDLDGESGPPHLVQEPHLDPGLQQGIRDLMLGLVDGASERCRQRGQGGHDESVPDLGDTAHRPGHLLGQLLAGTPARPGRSA